jgi:hypothetical protein
MGDEASATAVGAVIRATGLAAEKPVAVRPICNPGRNVGMIR